MNLVTSFRIARIILIIIAIAILAFVCEIDVVECQVGGGGFSSWLQLGSSINGDAFSYRFLGKYTAINGDGTIILAGGLYGGFARVMKWNASLRRWEQWGSKSIKSRAQIAISHDGTMIAATDARDDYVQCSDYDPRIVRFYEFKKGINDWVQGGLDLRSGDDIIYDMDMSGDGTTIAIAYRSITTGSTTYVKVYKFNAATSKWMQLGPTIMGDAISDSIVQNLAISISRDGATLAVRCGTVDDAVPSVSRVRVYKYASAQTRWTQLGSNIEGEPTGSSLGLSVAISGDGTVIALGFPSRGKMRYGVVEVYKYLPSSSRWVQVGGTIIGESSYTLFGLSVALSVNGTTLAVSDPYYSGGGKFINGQVQVYSFSSTISSWLQLGLDMNGKSSYNYFGLDVDISSDGRTLVVGAPYYDGNVNDKEDVGQVTVYKYNAGAPTRCNVTWNLYNSRPDQLVGPIRNGTIFTSPPPCNTTNIAAILPLSPTCNIRTNGTVIMKLYSQDMSRLVHYRLEQTRYFLFGNAGRDISDGRIAPGTYNLQVNVNGWDSTPIRFTLRGNGSC